jgi:hypothetical protein
MYVFMYVLMCCDSPNLLQLSVDAIFHLVISEG